MTAKTHASTNTGRRRKRTVPAPALHRSRRPQCHRYRPEAMTDRLELRDYYRRDGKTIKRTESYDTKTGKKTQTDHFRRDGKTIERTDYYDPKTGKILGTDL